MADMFLGSTVKMVDKGGGEYDLQYYDASANTWKSTVSFTALKANDGDVSLATLDATNASFTELKAKKAYGVKRDKDGIVQFTAAPTATVSITAAGTETKTCGITNSRNFIKGVLSVSNTGTTSKATMTAYLITPGGSTLLGSCAGTPGATLAFTKTVQVATPGSIKIKGAVTAGALSYAKAKSLSINDMSTLYIAV